MKFTPQLSSDSGLFQDNPAVGEDSQCLRRILEDLLSDYYRPLSRQWANPIMRFHNLKAEWEESASMLSSITEIAMHPAYQQIIGMGTPAITLILHEMSIEEGHWFWALRSITGIDPVPTEYKGRIREMTEAWLKWGEEQLYL